MNPGRRNTRVWFQGGTATNTKGERVTAWSDIIEPEEWVHIDWEKGKEMIRAGRVEASQAAVVTMMHRSDITARMRIRTGGTSASPTGLLQIHSITAPDGIGDLVELVVSKTDAD